MRRPVKEPTHEALERQGLEPIEIPYDKTRLDGGGIQCSTCPVIRDPV